MSSISGLQHVAIIMDGNGRWAKARFLPRMMGHKAGVDAARCTIETAVKRKIPYLSLFAFGQENWQRPAEEVGFLMELMLLHLQKELPLLKKHQIRFRMIGDRLALNPALQAAIHATEEATREHQGLQLFLAINYSGQWDIQQAVERFLKEQSTAAVAAGDTRSWQSYLSLHGAPAPDLFIRTSGEQRISNFYLWDLAYTELYFCPTLWPDFDALAFEKALNVFTERNRRFGRVLEKNESLYA